MPSQPQLEDGEKGWELAEGDTRDSGDAEKTVLDLCRELSVGRFIGAWSDVSYVSDEAWCNAVDVCAGSFGVEGESGGLDEARIDNVAA